MTLHRFGKGCGAYLSGFKYSPEASRMLLDLLMALAGIEAGEAAVADDARVETAWYPDARTLVVLNDADAKVSCSVRLAGRAIALELAPLEMRFVEVDQA